MPLNLIERYFEAFNVYGENDAFCKGKDKLSYSNFFALINGSRALLEAQDDFCSGSTVGVLCDNSVETYAAVFAIWFSGGIFFPINKNTPKTIAEEQIIQHNIKLILTAESTSLDIYSNRARLLNNKGATSEQGLPPFNWGKDQVMYILNTSGSTGTPKNVPITLRNVTAFIEGFIQLYPELDASDKFLQTYELTADAAFTGYLIPFLLGASVYTVVENQFRPFSVARVLSENPISWVQVTPSLLACLQPFFNSLYFPKIKHFHFGGEALPTNMLDDWRKRIPNAEVSNVYGPTETTITASIYKCLPGEKLKSRNNVVSIGRPLKNVETKIKHRQQLTEPGELYIAGKQVMRGYCFQESQPFQTFSENSQFKQFYPTGDLVAQDNEGYLYYFGRINDQVKINGYRVDLIEVENMVRKVSIAKGNVAAVVIDISPGIKKLIVFIENYTGDGQEITRQLENCLQAYKIPGKIIGVPRFPLGRSGKTDKKALIAQYYKT